VEKNERQAGAHQTGEEINVSQEMISAGVAALDFWRTAGTDEVTVVEIYKAMRDREEDRA
jgi:hypothetical protein